MRRLKHAILVSCGCGEAVPLLLADVGPVQCRCGAEYNPRTGKQLSVCEGFEPPAGWLERLEDGPGAEPAPRSATS